MKRSPLRRKTPLRARRLAMISAEEISAPFPKLLPIARRDAKPVKPRKRLLAKRATERRSSRVRDEAYLAWLRLQPCAVGKHFEALSRQSAVTRLSPELALRLASESVCSGPTDPDHERAGVVGMGQKASDRRAWAVCRRHHQDRHDLTGVFFRWTREELNEFIRDQIADHNARYDRELAAAGSGGAVPA